MNRLAQPIRRTITALFSLAVMVGIAHGTSRAADVDSQTFWPASWQQGSSELRLFPESGDEVAVALPDAVKRFMSISFSPDGKALYGYPVQLPVGPPSEITKIEIKPSTQSVVPGSKGLGITILTLSSSRKIFVSGWALHNGVPECGYFEIDSVAATSRTLRAGCRDGSGSISPDGKQAAITNNKALSLLNFETGAVQVIKAASAARVCTWSPDGTSIACNRDGKILVVDVNTLRLREIGGAGNGPAEWSPDGKSLLVLRSQPSCLATLYGESLEVIDAKSGRRSWVKSAHCNVAGGYYGWLDRDIAR